MEPRRSRLDARGSAVARRALVASTEVILTRVQEVGTLGSSCMDLTIERPVREDGDHYLAGLPLQQRRQNGQVYTPAHLVDFVLRQAGYVGTPGATFLDPACGAGAFLEAAVRVLAHEKTTAGARQRLLNRVEAELFGVDVDEHACELAIEAVRRAVQAVSPGSLPRNFFRGNVVRADFLAPRGLGALPHATFDFVCGNPPYVSATRIAPAKKAQLRRRFTTASGRLDLYSLFIERSVDVLAADGTAALITPDKFLVSQSARGLRSFLAERRVMRSIARFSSHRVFADAATVPCVSVFSRDARDEHVEVVDCVDVADGRARIEVTERTRVTRASLTSAPWYLSTNGALALARRLQAGRLRVAQVTLRISAGPATGRDGIYVFPRGTQPQVEPELLRPVVRGRDLDAYRLEDPELDILLPYTFDLAGTPHLIDLARFPGAARYLKRHREELVDRHCVRAWEKPWYDLHDQPATDLSTHAKILVPDVAQSNRFVVDEGRYFPLHSAYYLLPRPGTDLYFLVGLLNSSVAAFFVRVFSPQVKDGFNRYRQQFLHEIPVPSATPREAAKLAAAARRGDAATVDQIVRQLFALTDDDLALIGHITSAAP